MLDVRDLSVAYGANLAVDGVSFEISSGEVYALVGESGCGKTSVALAVMRYLPRGGTVTSGSIAVDGQEVLHAESETLRRMRSGGMAMVYQNPASALNPSMPVGQQVAEAIRGQSNDKAIELLRRVRLPRAEYVFDRYPHQLSGGMQQRVVIAIALASNPKLLVLDEPTTGLDATVEAGVLGLIADLQRERGMAILFITHNLSIVRRIAHRVGVLYAGRLVEEGRTGDVFTTPAHPYTRGLLASAPRPGARRGLAPLRPIPGQPPGHDRPHGCAFAPRCEFRQPICTESQPPLRAVEERPGLSRCFFATQVLHNGTTYVTAEPVAAMAPPEDRDLLVVQGVRKAFRTGGSTTVAVDDVSFTIGYGETFGLVGESGSGKSTLARTIAGLERLDGGTTSLDDIRLSPDAERRPRQILRKLQMVFQDPDSTLNPSHTIQTILDRPLRRLTRLGAPQRARRMQQLMRAVQLDPAILSALPSQLSGGQKQRVAIARAFAAEPGLVLCDEPVSSLDVSVQAAILNLLDSLQRSQSVSYLFISHDIEVVRYLADHVGVMYGGRLVEIGPADAVFAPPHHPYTDLLLSATPAPEALSHPNTDACVFHTRCPRAIAGVCDAESPPWRTTEAGAQIRCHVPLHEL